MKSILRLFAGLLIALMCVGSIQAIGQAASSPAGWQAKVDKALPLLGHRNWILIVDSAYPLQSSPGVETLETNASQAAVLAYTLRAIDRSVHVRPDVFMDAELPFIPEQDAPGVTAHRALLKKVLGERPIHSLNHEQLLQKIGDAGKSFNVLILKTNLSIPYTSVFLQLNCKYWADDAEARLRAAMKKSQGDHE